MLLAIDPGTTHSALVLYDAAVGLCAHYRTGNDWILSYLRQYDAAPNDVLVIERVASYGMPVGDEVFETVRYAGRFEQEWVRRGLPCYRITRADVKITICGQSRAKDGNVRQELINRFGGPQATKKGGPLYKVAGDSWQALAVACAWADPNRPTR